MKFKLGDQVNERDGILNPKQFDRPGTVKEIFLGHNTPHYEVEFDGLQWRYEEDELRLAQDPNELLKEIL